MTNLGGRPTRFTPELEAAILDAISKNIPYKLAAEANGIAERTLYDWLDYAKRDKAQGIDSEFVRFSQALKATEVKKIHEHLKCMEDGMKNWQARAWILERRWRELFGADAGIIQEIKDEFEAIKKAQGIKE